MNNEHKSHISHEPSTILYIMNLENETAPLSPLDVHLLLDVHLSMNPSVVILDGKQFSWAADSHPLLRPATPLLRVTL